MKGGRGSLSAFVVCLMTSLVALVGLVNDGGELLLRYRVVTDRAEAAARVGAQQVEGVREGRVRIDADRARDAALAHLLGGGLDGSVEVSSDSVTVTVSSHRRPKFLGLIGVRGAVLRIRRTARLVEG